MKRDNSNYSNKPSNVDNSIPVNRRRTSASAQSQPPVTAGIPKRSSVSGSSPGIVPRPAVPKLSGAAKNKSTNSSSEKLKFSEMAKEKGWADVELIEGIERDIVEGRVNVNWDSIAGLSEAKHLLQEAVVLPLVFYIYYHV